MNEVEILAAARLLKPLRKSAANGIKFYSAAELVEIVKDRAWLVKVTNVINLHWRKNNASKQDYANRLALPSSH
jgi:hypothetical protein